MKSLLIADTTREERERIVAESIGNIDGACDGCRPGLIEMYQDYIDGKAEMHTSVSGVADHLAENDSHAMQICRNIFKTLEKPKKQLLDMLPVRGKIIQRSVNDILVDLGTVEGMKKDVVLDVIKAGKITTSDKGLGVTYEEKNHLGTIKITRSGEEISQGILDQNGFYDRVNVGDEVLVKFRPDEKSEEDAQIADNSPAAGENGKRILPEDEKQKKLDAREMGLVKTPAIIELIRGLKS